ncbi:hypothetical protein HYDPIDRAFT_23894 [Hydnomerulius pinastri MD-312]|nr:hypothetical protein HYDPIDRAFT_23894 [Hydnomerulius pinastri MD-312]
MATPSDRALKDINASLNASNSSSGINGDKDAFTAAGYKIRPPVDLRYPPPSDQITNDYPPIFQNNCRFRPFAEDLNPLNETPRWQKDLERQFNIIFKESVLVDYPIDEMATWTLQIVGSPTKVKMRTLAMAVFMHWTRMQFDSGNPNVAADELVFLIGRISHHLESVSLYAKQDFVDELNILCVEKLKITWRWFVDVSTGKDIPLPRENLLARVVAMITMLGHLFRGGHLQHAGALVALEDLAAFAPLPDAVATIYALLLQLGPKFAIQGPGWHFLHGLLAKLTQFTVGRVPVDPLCQLVFAMKTLAEEWQSSAHTTLYHTSTSIPRPKEQVQPKPTSGYNLQPCLHPGPYPPAHVHYPQM